MRRWQMVSGWIMAVAVASAVGFLAIALVGVGLDPLSSGGTAANGSIGALGSQSPTSGPTDPTARSTAQLPLVTPGPLAPGQSTAPGAATDDVSESAGDSSPAASPRPSTVSSSGTAPKPKPTSSSASTITRSVSTVGGSATARCTGDRIVLSAWSPAPGYSVDEVKPGPGNSVEVSFESSSRKVKIKAECSKGIPRFETESRSESGSDDD